MSIQFSFMAVVNGVILPVISNILDFRNTVSSCEICLLGVCPLIFLEKFISLMSSGMMSSSGNHFIPATFMLSPLSDNDSGGS